jgi:hypothetical protein
MRTTAWIVACYLGIGSLFPGSDFSQLPRLVQAYQHFALHVQEAKAEGNFFTALEFLRIHFLKPSAHRKTNHNHHNLPFQSLDHIVVSLLGIPVSRDLPELEQPDILRKSLFSFLPLIGQAFKLPILQPPVFS